MIEVEVFVLDVIEDLLIGVAWERRLAAQEHLQTHAQRPDVALLGVSTTQDLRRDLVRRAHDVLVRFPRVNLVAETEVNNFDVGFKTPARQQKIFRLEVPVADVGLVAVVHSVEYLPHELLDYFFFEEASVYDEVEHFASIAHLHDHVLVFVVFIGLIKLEDVGVVECPQRFYLQLHHFYVSFYFGFGDALDCLLERGTFIGPT